MRHQHQRRAPAGLLRENEVDDRRAGFAVEIAGRLVRREDQRIGRERPRERHPLLLAPRKLGGVVGEPVGEAHGGKLGLGPRESVGFSGQLQRNCHIFKRRHGRDQLERLKHDPYVFATKTRYRIFRERPEVASVDSDGAPVGTLESGEDHEQRRLARAGGAQETDRLALGYAQADAFEDVDPRGACAQRKVDPGEFDDWTTHEGLNPEEVETLYDAPHKTLRAFSPYRLFGRWLQIVTVLAGAIAAGVAAAQAAPLRILAFGDSLTAGAGLAAEDSLPAQLKRRLLANGWDVEVVNAGVSGDTSAMGLARLDYTLSSGPIDLAIVELGANDMLLGLDTKQARANLDQIVTTLKEKGATVMLVAMVSSENYGQAYKKDFDSIYPDLARKHGITMIPFFMEGVWGHPNMVIDGVHPNPAGVAKIIGKIAPQIEKTLASMGARKSARTQ